MKSAELHQLLEHASERQTPAVYAQAARAVAQYGQELRTVRIALLASYTIEPLVPFLRVEAARRNWNAETYVGAFNAAPQELLDSASGCHAHKPDIIFWAQLLEDVCPSLTHDFLLLDEEEVERHIAETVASISRTLQGFRQLSGVAVVVHNFPLPAVAPLGIYEVAAECSQTAALRRLNRRLAEVAKEIPNVFVLDFDLLCAGVGYRDWRDDKMWHLGRAPLSAAILPRIASVQTAFVEAIQGSPRKCLVLDLDNTLWGGVVGEVGVKGIKLGQTYPGSVFREFQQSLLALRRRGVLLAINSKNNPTDVLEVFDTHPEMVLKLEDFAAMRVNWQPKPENMIEIARELNIGVDSLVFFDDNPAERLLLREALPEVLTLDVPADPLYYGRALHDCLAFERLSFTAEDRRRGDMYREQTARAELQKSATSLEEFLHSLQMRIEIARADEYSFERVLELLHKTNQFNLTTRRHSASRLAEMIADPAFGVFHCRVRDRFGDNGITGVLIARSEGETVYLDTLLLSCRVIGRTIETALLAFLTGWAREAGARVIEGEFLPTKKNAPAMEFFAQHGFAIVNQTEAGSFWRLDLDEAQTRSPAYIEVLDETTRETASVGYANVG